MSYNPSVREEELKLKVAADWFAQFDCTEILRRIDFSVKLPHKNNSLDFEDDFLLWAEAKQQPTDLFQMLTQLLVTIFQDAKNLNPPKFLGCFDTEKIAFVEYHYAMPVFAVNDFDWTQTPSRVDDKSIKTVRKLIDNQYIFTFYFGEDQTELKNFIKANFIIDDSTNLLATQIDRNNYTFIYQRWCDKVKPSIVANWELLKKNYSIYDRDFFLAELNIDDHGTVIPTDDKRVDNDFYISFDANVSKPYHLSRKDTLGLDVTYEFGFKAGGLERYSDFWKRYKRPPKKEYWNYIVNRLDLLVPQDVRERKGAFFTPQIWVEKSQQYIADTLGENWQDNYTVWDCCAGTGNLLAGLTNKYNIWASTLDQQDVEVMHDRIRNGANLLDNHVFQFDFLNDNFDKLPQPLQDIIHDEEKRKKLVIYINPPYAEAGTTSTVVGSGQNKIGVANATTVRNNYKDRFGLGIRELYVQFLIRIYVEMQGCVIAEFSKLKILQGTAFKDFRNFFKAKLEALFVIPANSFDNVSGAFPIGFFVWNTNNIEQFASIEAQVYDERGVRLQNKIIAITENDVAITKWISRYVVKDNSNVIGYTGNTGPDYQHNNYLYLCSKQGFLKNGNPNNETKYPITDSNVMPMCIYFSVRLCIPATWLNDRDQFLYPNDGWKTDKEFQNDCLAYTLFHGQNRISSSQGVNYWIPFTEEEVDAKEKFVSHFMTDYIAGKSVPTCAVCTERTPDLFDNDNCVDDSHNVPTVTGALQFSSAAIAVFDAGRELWQYYHAQPDANPNASLYDIRAYFQGRNDTGKMNNTSEDEHYNKLMAKLRQALKVLALQIEPKVYEYGFLKR